MFKIMWGLIGTGLFWLLWPVWVVYFRLSGTRSRVLVVVEDEVLLLKGWLGDKKYNLPGGGTKKQESTRSSAIRELYEETGITVAESSLTSIGTQTHKKRGLQYTADYFVLQLPSKPELKLNKLEIFSAAWVGLNNLSTVKLGDDALFALKRYQPLEQASLL